MVNEHSTTKGAERFFPHEQPGEKNKRENSLCSKFKSTSLTENQIYSGVLDFLGRQGTV